MGIRYPPLISAGALCLLLAAGGCSDPDKPGSASGDHERDVPTDPLADAPADWAAFLPWAEEKLQSQPDPVPLPDSPITPQPLYGLVRLDEAARLAKAQKTCAWTARPANSVALATIGPFRSDIPRPMFSPQPVPKESPAGKDSLALMMSGFRVRCEDVGSIELTLRVPYGRHVTLAWSRLGSVIIPVESHEDEFTVRVLTDGFTEWKGPRDQIAVLTDGLGEGVIEIRSLRFLPRTQSYPRPIAVRRARLGHEIRTAICAHCPAEIVYEDVTLPKDATLHVGLGHAAEAYPGRSADQNAQAPARTRFEVIVTHQGTPQTVLDQEVERSEAWVDAAAALAPWSGKPVTVTLKCTSTSPDAVAFWGNPVIHEPLDDPPIVVIYLIDTVASEHLGFHGYQRKTMPRLAEMAERGVWFSQMFSNSSRTIESIPDLMLSMPTERHQVHHNSTPTPEGLVTIAEVLRAAGLATVSFCTNVNSGPRQGMDQGFDTFVDKISAPADNLDRTIPLEEVMTWIDHHRDRAMFLYIHTAEPHSPYTPPEGFRDRFDPDYTGPYTGVEFEEASDPRDLAHIQALYDEELVYADARLGTFLDALQEQGLLEKAHFFVTSDHGEEFLEHNEWEHGRNLHNEETRIPLVAFGPTFDARGELDVPAQLLDLMPTILDMFGLPAPYPLHGKTLLPLLRRTPGSGGDLSLEPWRRRNMYASNHNYRIVYDLLEYSVIEQGRWKLLLGAAETAMYRGGPKSRFRLFDLESDPRERHNLINARQNVARRLAEDLVRWRAEQRPYDPGARGPTVIDVEQIRDLEALGYVGDKSPDDNGD